MGIIYTVCISITHILHRAYCALCLHGGLRGFSVIHQGRQQLFPQTLLKNLFFLMESISVQYHAAWDGMAQSVQRLATGWTVPESNPGEGEIFRWAHLASCVVGAGVLSLD